MILLDTNIFIYLFNRTVDASLLIGHKVSYASVTKIEALGFANITISENNYLTELFAECQQITLTDDIQSTAIKLRQQKNMSLGDSIIAATALVNDCVLWTTNTDDFKHLDYLRLYDPRTITSD